MKWTSSEIPSQSGKIAIITGASSGIGRITTRVLASKGAEVIMAVRNVPKGEGVADAIRAEQPEAKLHVMELDLSKLRTVRSFAAAFLASFDKLNLLINNAGLGGTGKLKKPTEDGFGMTMGVNHLGHFALTGLVLPRLLSTPQSRVVTVTSGAHRNGKIDFDTFHTDTSDSGSTYSASKLANVLFTLELERQFVLINANSISVAADPGPSKTDGVRNMIKSLSNPVLRGVLNAVSALLMQTPEMGALPILRAATGSQVTGGELYKPGRLMGMRGYPEAREPGKSAKDKSLARQLWERSAELTDVQYTAFQVAS